MRIIIDDDGVMHKVFTKDEVTAMLKELEKEINGEAWTRAWSDERIVEMESVSKIIQQKIYKMEE